MNRRELALILSDDAVETLDAVEFLYGRRWTAIVGEAVEAWLVRVAEDEDVAKAKRARRIHQGRQRFHVVGDE